MFVFHLILYVLNENNYSIIDIIFPEPLVFPSLNINRSFFNIKYLPNHSHNYTKPTGWVSGGNWESTKATVFRNNDAVATSGSAGLNQPHENMPPYYVLVYIMKL